MTDHPAEDAQAAADRLVEALHSYVEDGPTDLQEPADALIAALTGSVPDATIAALLTRAAALVDQFWVQAGRMQFGHQATAQLLGPAFKSLDAELFVALHPFDQEAELAAAEERVTSLERQLTQVNRDVEDALNAGDIDRVMALRESARVTIPGQLGEARSALLALTVEAAQFRLSSIAPRAEQLAAVDRATKIRDAAAERLRSANDDLFQAQLAVENSDRLRAEAQQQVHDLKALLDEHAAGHARDQQARLRQFAGLTPITA